MSQAASFRFPTHEPSHHGERNLSPVDTPARTQQSNRAVRISRRLWELELKHVAATERLETLRQGALLADASGRVVRANTAAKAMLDDGTGIFLDNGRLAAAGSEILQKLIASCTRTSPSLG